MSKRNSMPPGGCVVESVRGLVQVRAGTGGDEAALFASDLFRMYQRFAEAQRWRFEVRAM